MRTTMHKAPISFQAKTKTSETITGAKTAQQPLHIKVLTINEEANKQANNILIEALTKAAKQTGEVAKDIIKQAQIRAEEIRSLGIQQAAEILKQVIRKS